MTHNLKSFTLGIAALTVTEIYFAFGRIYLDPSFASSLANGAVTLWIEVAWILALAVTGSFGWGVIFLAGETKCPECHQKFMFTRKKRLLTGRAIHRGVEVTNYKTTYSCDNCGHTERNVPEVAQRELPPPDD
jgi:predicted nucleic-acid-binding Zn-ribbon protein